ncbi:TniB family NTP-binding protein [Paracoccus yeei]|uniref:TniB family NTP-binding protein n=2 Tax=Paracoccus yeei TaxID=147645 RepID=UPI001303583D|nr:TniB family NTP-binding protein [Paracoccus yeei]
MSDFSRSRMDRLRSLYVERDRDSDFRRHMGALLTSGEDPAQPLRPRLFGATRETRGLVVTGAPGQGKTSLVARGLRDLLGPAAGPAAMPTLAIDVPSPATLKSLGAEIIRVTGLDMSGARDPQHKIWERVRHRMALFGVVVLWIDEAHDVFRTGLPRERHGILNTIKTLMKGDHAVVPVPSGLPMLEDAVRSDEQVSRRMAKLSLRPVTWECDGRDLMELATGYCDRAGLASDMSEADLLALARAADYGFGRMIEGVLDAIELAGQERATSVDRQHLAESWGFREGVPFDANPFLGMGKE